MKINRLICSIAQIWRPISKKWMAHILNFSKRVEGLITFLWDFKFHRFLLFLPFSLKIIVNIICSLVIANCVDIQIHAIVIANCVGTPIHVIVIENCGDTPIHVIVKTNHVDVPVNTIVITNCVDTPIHTTTDFVSFPFFSNSDYFLLKIKCCQGNVAMEIVRYCYGMRQWPQNV